MVNYPNGHKGNWTQTATSAGRRGMGLEADINATNSWYLDRDIAVIHKKPTPVQIVKVDYPKRSAAKITEAYFKTPSTTDYNGLYRGRYIDFEAKECHLKTAFPLKSIHPHQIKHLSAVVRHGGIGFMIVRFTSLGMTWLVPADRAIEFWDHHVRSSIPYKWFTENGKLIPMTLQKPVDYLSVVDKMYFGDEGGK